MRYYEQLLQVFYRSNAVQSVSAELMAQLRRINVQLKKEAIQQAQRIQKEQSRASIVTSYGQSQKDKIDRFQRRKGASTLGSAFFDDSANNLD